MTSFRFVGQTVLRRYPIDHLVTVKFVAHRTLCYARIEFGENCRRTSEVLWTSIFLLNPAVIGGARGGWLTAPTLSAAIAIVTLSSRIAPSLERIAGSPLTPPL